MGEATMSMARAREIVAACIENVLVREGVRSDAAPLSGYSLAELVEANSLLAAENKVERAFVDGKRTTSMVCDDRLIAALYVVQHYLADQPDECAPHAVLGAAGVFVLDTSFYADGGITDRPARSDVQAEEDEWSSAAGGYDTEWCSGCGDEPILVARANAGRLCARCEERALDVVAYRRRIQEARHVR